MAKTKDFSGQQFGYVKVLEPTGKTFQNSSFKEWKCLCTCCGKIFNYAPSYLVRDQRKAEKPISCGCNKNITHGLSKNKLNNGKQHPIYYTYFAMMSRCYNPNYSSYPLYGAKGVTVCEEWKKDKNSFFTWAENNGWEPGLVLDKDILCKQLNINPPIYSSKTCKFITPSENTLESHLRESCNQKSKHIKLSAEQVKEINALYSSGMDRHEIANKYSVSYVTIWRITR